MDPVDAEEALTYAVSREMVAIYLIVLIGILLQLVGPRFIPVSRFSRIGRLFGTVFTVAGFVTTFVGSVALLYKLVADAVART